MIISKELYLEKPLPAGFYPIVIRVSHLGKERIIDTSISCHLSHWDRLLKSINNRDVAHSIKNIQIDAIYSRIVSTIQDYLDRILADNLELLLNNIYNNSKPTLHEPPGMKPADNIVNEEEAPIFFSELIREKINSVSSLNTRRGYIGFMNYFNSNYGEGPELKQLSSDFVKKFCQRLEKDYPVKSSMRLLHASHLNAVITFGKDIGMIPNQFSSKIPSYPLFPSDRNLSESELRNIFRLCIKKIRKDPDLKRPDTLSLAIFILDIAFQGIAPTDLASLKVGDISFSRISPDINRMNCIPETLRTDIIEIATVKTVRKKTGVPVSITTSINHIEPILKALSKGKCRDDYLIPCFDFKRQYTPEQRQSRLSNFFHKMSISLNSVINRELKTAITKKITYYFARHAFCNLVDSLDIPRHLIQYLIGHRVTVLERNYLRRISIAEQAAISLRLFNLLSDSP